jgi:hypothetical protein
MKWELHLVDSKNVYCDIFHRGTKNVITIYKGETIEETREVALKILNLLNDE